MEGEWMIEDVGGDGLTVSFNTTLVRGLMIACVFVVVSFCLFVAFVCGAFRKADVAQELECLVLIEAI